MLSIPNASFVVHEAPYQSAINRYRGFVATPLGVIVRASLRSRLGRLCPIILLVVLALALATGCAPRNLSVADVVQKLQASGASVAPDGTMFPMVGGKDCISATWLQINGHNTALFEYKDPRAAHNAKFQIPHAVRVYNVLFSPAANAKGPLAPAVKSSLLASFDVED